MKLLFPKQRRQPQLFPKKLSLFEFESPKRSKSKMLVLVARLVSFWELSTDKRKTHKNSCVIIKSPFSQKNLYFLQKWQNSFCRFLFGLAKYFWLLVIFMRLKTIVWKFQKNSLSKYISNIPRTTRRASGFIKGEKMEDRLLMISERNRHEVAELLPDEKCTNRLALYFQNFSDQTRIRILSALSIRELCVNDLSKVLGQNQTTISHQLKSLKDQGMVDCKRDGKILIYFLKSDSVNDVMLYAVKAIGWIGERHQDFIWRGHTHGKSQRRRFLSQSPFTMVKGAYCFSDALLLWYFCNISACLDKRKQNK